MTLTPQLQLSGAWIAIEGHFAVHVFHGDLSLADMDQLQAFGDRWVKAHPGKRAELVIVFPSNARMSSEQRSRIAELIKRWEPDRIASATVILAQGMLGSMQRSVLTGLQLIAPPSHPVKVFGNVAQAITWLLPYVQSVNPGAQERDLQKEVAALCDTFERRTS